MIARELRFTTKNFEFLRKKMKVFHRGIFSFFYGTGKPNHRFAVVISKKNIRLAVNRNRVRRQTYELIRTNILPQLNRPVNLICLYKKNDLPQNLAELRSPLQEFLKFWNEGAIGKNKPPFPRRRSQNRRISK